jgi:hypothetical protein
MHWRTYERLWPAADDAEQASHLMLLTWLEKLEVALDRL